MKCSLLASLGQTLLAHSLVHGSLCWGLCRSSAHILNARLVICFLLHALSPGFDVRIKPASQNELGSCHPFLCPQIIQITEAFSVSWRSYRTHPTGWPLGLFGRGKGRVRTFNYFFQKTAFVEVFHVHTAHPFQVCNSINLWWLSKGIINQENKSW